MLKLSMGLDSHRRHVWKVLNEGWSWRVLSTSFASLKCVISSWLIGFCSGIDSCAIRIGRESFTSGTRLELEILNKESIELRLWYAEVYRDHRRCFAQLGIVKCSRKDSTVVVPDVLRWTSVTDHTFDITSTNYQLQTTNYNNSSGNHGSWSSSTWNVQWGHCIKKTMVCNAWFHPEGYANIVTGAISTECSLKVVPFQIRTRSLASRSYQLLKLQRYCKSFKLFIENLLTYHRVMYIFHCFTLARFWLST